MAAAPLRTASCGSGGPASGLRPPGLPRFRLWRSAVPPPALRGGRRRGVAPPGSRPASRLRPPGSGASRRPAVLLPGAWRLLASGLPAPGLPARRLPAARSRVPPQPQPPGPSRRCPGAGSSRPRWPQSGRRPLAGGRSSAGVQQWGVGRKC
ncbi:hypothetical protein GUJ93_ZPchr0014g46619 [Zizania palustris]|uniref:Uncharacterized protein n=1 Tax=Zizania palustris TaxID=103762 RepID=A0A8J5TB15_ZIZPA|nr:hypothetical protein GUJ93_ZPchr0014g46619 [Zizania palustris]